MYDHKLVTLEGLGGIIVLAGDNNLICVQSFIALDT